MLYNASELLWEADLEVLGVQRSAGQIECSKHAVEPE